MLELLLDDHLLLDALRRRPRPGLPAVSSRLWTTGLWHHRLCRALSDDTVSGIFSRTLHAVGARSGDAVRARLVDLPPDIGSVSLRHLAWPMAQLLHVGVRLNLLSLEALAAAEELGAMICLSAVNENPPLVAAAEARGVEVRIIEP